MTFPLFSSGLLEFRDFTKSTKNCAGPRNPAKSIEKKNMYMTKYDVFFAVFEN